MACHHLLVLLLLFIVSTAVVDRHNLSTLLDTLIPEPLVKQPANMQDTHDQLVAALVTIWKKPGRSPPSKW